MQQVTVQEQVEYASVGWRFAAVLVDTAVLLGIFLVAVMVWAFVLVAQGRVDPNDPAAAQALAQDLVGSDWIFNAIFFGALFVYYTVLESIFSASVGKLAFRMRVVMADGSRPTGLAIVVRNLDPHPGGVAAVHPLRHLVSGEFAAAAARRPRRAHGGRAPERRRRQAGPGRPAQAPPCPARPGAAGLRAARAAGAGSSAGSRRRLDAAARAAGARGGREPRRHARER